MKSFVDQKLESHIRISLTSNKFPEPVPNEFHVKLLVALYLVHPLQNHYILINGYFRLNFDEIFCEIESTSNEVFFYFEFEII